MSEPRLEFIGEIGNISLEESTEFARRELKKIQDKRERDRKRMIEINRQIFGCVHPEGCTFCNWCGWEMENES